MVEIVNEIGKKEGFLLIIERAPIVYSPKAIDITDRIVKEYNTLFAKESKDKQKAKNK